MMPLASAWKDSPSLATSPSGRRRSRWRCSSWRSARTCATIFSSAHHAAPALTVIYRAARELALSNGEHRAYVIGYPFVTLEYSTVEFLAGAVDGGSLPNKPITSPLRDGPRSKGPAFFVQMGASIYGERVRQLQAISPGGRLDVVRNSAGVPVLTRYLVEHGELVAATARTATTP